MSRTCEICKHWDQQHPKGTTGHKEGRCRLRPPAVFHDGTTMWPETNSGDWCGDHETEGLI